MENIGKRWIILLFIADGRCGAREFNPFPHRPKDIDFNLSLSGI